MTLTGPDPEARSRHGASKTTTAKVEPVWKPHWRRFRRLLGGPALRFAGPGLARHLMRSWRYELVDGERFEEGRRAGGASVLLFWHGRMLLAMPKHVRRNVTVLVSPSDDGGLATDLLEDFGYRIIRGSSNKHGTRAMREMLVALRSGSTVAVTPDGPRGPRYSMGVGPAFLARETGCPVLPCGYACDRAWHLTSWDQYTIPRFGARIAQVYRDLVHVPRNASRDDLERLTTHLREELRFAERSARERLDAPRDKSAQTKGDRGQRDEDPDGGGCG